MPNHDLLEIDEAEHVHTQLGNSYLLVLCSRKEMLYAFDLKNIKNQSGFLLLSIKMNFFKSIPSSKETNEEELLVISYP